MMQSVLQAIQNALLLEEYGEIDPKRITLKTDLKSLGLDSLDLVCLVNDLEEKYKIDIRNHERNTISTVGDVVDLVESILKEQKQSI
jgi:acyl carrier protein